MKLSENETNGTADKTGIHKLPRVWILTADRHSARLYRKAKSALELIGTATPSHRDSSHKIHADAIRQDEATFAREISQWLDGNVRKDAFDRLVLIAPPHMLGDLRKALGPGVQEKVVAEIDKDLTGMNERALERELAKILWF